MMEPRRFHWILCALGLAVALSPGCKAKPKPEEPAEEQPPPATEEGTPTDLIDQAAKEEAVKKEVADVMYRHHFDAAKRYRDALELESALAEVEKALNFRPTEEEAL